MPHEFRFKPAQIENMVFTLEMTLTIFQWRKVAQAIDATSSSGPFSSVVWDLRSAIRSLIGQAEKEFQTSLEAFDGQQESGTTQG